MKFLAEVISTEEIAVWFADDAYVGNMTDGMYSLIGRIRSPLFPDYVSIEYKNEGKEHFKVLDYEKLIKEWNETLCNGQPPPPPPAPWICKPHFSPSCKLPPFCLMIMYQQPMPLEKVVLTESLKEIIKQQFINNKNTFDNYHGDTKAILLGTV